MEFTKTRMGEFARIVLDSQAMATNRAGNFCKAGSLDIRKTGADIILEANFQSGSRANGISLSLADAARLRDALTAALKLVEIALLFCTDEWVEVPLDQALLDVRNNAAYEAPDRNGVRAFACQLCADGIEHPKESDMQKERELEEGRQ